MPIDCCDFVLFAGQWWGGGVRSFQPYEAGGALPSIEIDCTSRPSQDSTPFTGGFRVSHFDVAEVICLVALLGGLTLYFAGGSSVLVSFGHSMSSFRSRACDLYTHPHLIAFLPSTFPNCPIKRPSMLSRKKRLMPNNRYLFFPFRPWMMLYNCHAFFRICFFFFRNISCDEKLTPTCWRSRNTLHSDDLLWCLGPRRWVQQMIVN